MSKFIKLSLILNIFLFVGCSDNNSIIAIAETEPVTTSGDAADDPAIVINYSNPQQSIILGTDKRAGVYSYDLSGKKISYAAFCLKKKRKILNSYNYTIQTATNITSTEL